MKKILFATVALSLLPACGIIPGIDPGDNPEVEAEFAIIYSKWLSEAAQNNRELSLDGLRIRMGAAQGEFKPGIQGTCSSQKIISINPNYWNKLPPNSTGNAERELLIYHELGHCTLGQAHPYVGGMRTMDTLMNPYLLTSFYQWRRENYIKEVFGWMQGLSENAGTSPAECTRPDVFGHD